MVRAAQSQMMTVQFDGDTLEACGTSREDAQVSIRRVCDALGISTEKQLAKLKRKAWATLTQRVMVADDGKPREHAMLALKSLPMWLATIDARRVKECVREKLARYQQHCHDVLAAHFLGIGKPATGVTHAELERILAPLLTALEGVTKAVANLVEQQDQVIQHLERQQQQIDRLNALLPHSAGALVVRGPTPATPQATVQDRLRHLGWPEANKKQRALIRRQANIWLMLRYGETPDVSGGPGGPCVYYAHQVALLDEAIGFVRTAVVKRELERERVTGPTLFTGVAG